MSIPKVAIVGRPNVGKSSLLNWLTRKRISVVDPAAGVTRDRVTFVMHEQGRHFELVDTGGIGIIDSDRLTEDVERQIQRGIDEADLILLVVDGKQGLVPLDLEVAKRLRGVTKNMLLVVNKCDSPKTDMEIAEFFRLTQSPSICTSVLADRHRDKLIETIVEHLPPPSETEAEEGEAMVAEPVMKLAIVGRRNVGKSTFINALAQTERMIVSEVAGTTRDSVDVRFELDGRAFMAIDTPGVRKRKSLANDVEYYGLVRAKRSIRRADVVFMFFDGTERISKVDKQLVEEIMEHHKPCVFVVNKWDLAKSEKMTTGQWAEYIAKMFPTLSYMPVACITAKEDRNTKQLINLAQSIFKQACTRVSTSQLNQVIRQAIVENPPSSKGTKWLRIYFATQVSTQPPTLVLKCNYPEEIDLSWKRYLLGVIRERLPFSEVPVKVYYRSRQDTSQLRSLEEIKDVDELMVDDEGEE
ncbi:MAG: ribosome biogenesis GTPase Der [Planctomycetales bacterium]